MEPRAVEHMLPGVVQEALSRIGLLLDTLFETAEDAIFLMDGIRFIDCNPATLRMFGCRTKDDIIGQTPIHFSPARQMDGVGSAEEAGRLVAAAMEGIPQQFEWRHHQLDGPEFEVEVRLNRCSVGGTHFLVAVVRDITARKRAEAAVRRQIAADGLVNDILGRCANCTPDQFDAHMDAALHDVATFIGVDHAYFFMTSPDRATYTCTHEACGPGVAPIKPQHRDVPAGSRPWIEASLHAGWLLSADLVNDPDHHGQIAPGDADVDPGCRSRLLVPTTSRDGAFAGAIGVDSHVRPVTWSDADIRLCKIVGSALTGMTERKRANERLFDEKQFSERLIDCLPGLFYLYDSDLRLCRWNRYVEAKMGYSPDELRGKRLEEWFDSDETRRQVVGAARAVLERGGATDFLECPLLEKGGSTTPYLVSGANIDSAGGPMLVGVGIDIAPRVRAETALAASERNYRELFNATNEALVIHDATGSVLDFNERACVLFGVDAAPARRLSINDLSLGEPPYSQAEADEKLRRALREGPQVFDWHSRRRDGTLFWSEVALRGFHSEGGPRVIASVRDITERKTAGLERERLMAELQAASSAKDQFLAVLSHELRNPLAAIQAGVGLLRQFSRIDGSRASHAVDVIERNVKLQARLVDDLLDLSRLVRGKVTLERARMQLGDAVLSAVHACRADAARAEVSLEVRAEPGIWIDADIDRVQQVVINLVFNGIKFTPKAGRVAVSVAARGQEGQVIVEDTGMGIEAERLPELFEMFRQGQVAARRAPGLGIGLAIVKSITELHGGRVWAESAGPGCGSRFTVALPLCDAPERREPIPPHSEHPHFKMLLVEDNSDTRAMLAETFAELGYEVVPAESGEGALKILERERVDVILADIGLPGIDGYEFLEKARGLPSVAHAPAFALTGYGQEKDVRRAHDAGYVDHFVKPVDVEKIDERIRARL